MRNKAPPNKVKSDLLKLSDNQLIRLGFITVSLMLWCTEMVIA